MKMAVYRIGKFIVGRAAQLADVTSALRRIVAKSLVDSTVKRDQELLM